MAADSFTGRTRELSLGGLSALQEAGSLIGPVYGSGLAFVAAGLGQWRFVFWLNLPLCLLVGLGLWWLGRRPDAARQAASASGDGLRQVDWQGAGALGLGLGLLMVALYPDDPASRAVNRYVIPLGLAAGVSLCFYGWRQARRLEPLIPRSVLRSRVFLGATAANLLTGAALMVALVDVPILGRAVYGLDQLGSAVLLTSFLAGLPVGALLGGLLAGRLGRRLTIAAGLAAAATCFWMMSGWGLDELGRRAWLVRRADLELALGGLGFGLVIVPLTASVLDLTGSRLHGLAGSLVVLARTAGMLAGLSALTAFGLRRFYEILSGLSASCQQPRLSERVNCLEQAVAVALLREYQAVFLVAAGLCLLAALVAVLSLRPARSGSVAAAQG
jgi:MFS family permease